MEKTNNKPQSQPRWEREEQVLLVVEYFSCNEDKLLIAKSCLFLSEFLRKRAELLGYEISEKYRNEYGIKKQMENLSHCNPQTGSNINGHESAWMYKIINEYLTDPQAIIYEAYEILKKYRSY